MKKMNIDWGTEPRLGKMPDSKLAGILSVSRQAVSQGRTKLNIPAYKPGPGSKPETEVEDMPIEIQEVQAGEVENGMIGSSGETPQPELEASETSKEELRKEARREAQKASATLEGTLKAADPAEVEVARGIVADMLSDAAVAVALGTTKFTIQRYIREKKLYAVKIGGGWKIPAEALKRFLSGE
jgi:excisionase family DNA binding protein